MSALVLPPFTVTAAAVAEISRLPGNVLIDVTSGGCCGRSYAFRLLDDAHEAPSGSQRFGCEGAWLHVTPAALSVLSGATLDHRSQLRPPRFRVLRNPNTPDTCPCRRSFGSAWPGPGQDTCRSYEPMPWDATFEPPARWRRQTGWTRENDAAPPR